MGLGQSVRIINAPAIIKNGEDEVARTEKLTYPTRNDDDEVKGTRDDTKGYSKTKRKVASGPAIF